MCVCESGYECARIRERKRLIAWRGVEAGPIGEENKKTQHTRKPHGRKHWMTIRIYLCTYICIRRRVRFTTSQQSRTSLQEGETRKRDRGDDRGNENWTCLCVYVVYVYIYMYVRRMYFPACERRTHVATALKAKQGTAPPRARRLSASCCH